MSASDWYYAQGSRRQGPTSLQGLLDLLRNGQVSTKDLVWRPGMADWKPAGSVPDLAEALAIPPSPAADALPTGDTTPIGAASGQSPQPDAQPGQAPPTAEPIGADPAGQAPHDYARHAMIALLLAIAGVVLLGGFLGVAALAVATNALSAMDRTGQKRGKGVAIAAAIIGILDVVVWFAYLASRLVHWHSR
jgi:hypothetical protein